MARAPLLLVLVAAMLAAATAAKLRDGDCPVCVGTLHKISELVPADDRTPAAAERTLKAYCKTATGKENRFCYYVGGTEDAASTVVKDIVGPLANSVPVAKICERLKQRDSQICDLVYDVEIDWKTADLNKLRVKDLKKIAADIRAPCQGCSEKSEFIRVINEARVSAGVGAGREL
eukprot:Unigene10692_Nuclearia_a/m.32705 Unigene10692_Nuclearia_a/g.32705  ORF Unigene10692_Nuclearia_a/g.32705 Unigene10692_Nuclearia_a/m.32705 type:complete len:176 (-) Unigene10692_Nuclearia_a:65-592(-)